MKAGRINQTLEYALEWRARWKVVPDKQIAALRAAEFWQSSDTRQHVLALVPDYRLSKFQRALPDSLQVGLPASRAALGSWAYLARNYANPLVEAEVKGIAFDFLECLDLYHSPEVEAQVKQFVLTPGRTYRDDNPPSDDRRAR